MSWIPLLVTLENWPSGKDGRLVIWRPCNLGGSNPAVDKIFCNVNLFCVPLSWIGRVQMKSSMTFIPGNRCIERKKDIFKIWPRSKTFKGVHTSFNRWNRALGNEIKWYDFQLQSLKKNANYSADITFHLGMGPALSLENATIACENSGMRLAVLPTPMLMTAAVDFLKEQS